MSRTPTATRLANPRRFVTVERGPWDWLYTGTRTELIQAGLIRADEFPEKRHWKGCDNPRDEPGRWSYIYRKGGGEFVLGVEYTLAEKAEQEYWELQIVQPDSRLLSPPASGAYLH